MKSDFFANTFAQIEKEKKKLKQSIINVYKGSLTIFNNLSTKIHFFKAYDVANQTGRLCQHLCQD